MKTINRILLLVILVVLLIIIEKISGVFSGFMGKNELIIEKTELDFGREIFGDKISIRDNIRVKQKAQFSIDGNYLGLGNENKIIEISFLSELGYTVDDIIKSEKIDSLLGDKVVGRTLVVILPLPDTLSFVEMRQDEKNNEWFWEGWVKDDINIKARKKFLLELEKNAYREFINTHANPTNSSSYIDAAKTILNYVNNGYKISNEIGFNSIIAQFEDPDIIEGSINIVTCDNFGNCVHKTQAGEKILD